MNVISENGVADKLTLEIVSLIESGINLKIEGAKLKGELEIMSAISNMAKQVAHDIRSPLSALNIAIHDLNGMSEERRLLIRNAAQRINDIANDLLQKSRQNRKGSHFDLNTEIISKELQPLMLPAAIDSIISEKRIQFRDKVNIKIDADLKDSFGIFASVNQIELSRIISNLINNSIEAFADENGEVVVSVTSSSSEAKILIKDNGLGMTEETLSKLGYHGFTAGKNETHSGNGIGVSHALTTIEKWGGKLQFRSQLNVGTEAEIILPRINNPEWFASQIQIKQGSTVVVLDDDLSIHQIWKGRFESVKSLTSGIKMLNFTSASEFLNFEIDDSMIFLIDYEFLNQKENGLELIRDRGLFSRSILITSHHEEPHIRETCEKYKIKLLPKQLAGFVPIKISTPMTKFDYLLIDNDPLIRMAWKLLAKDAAKHVKVFPSYSEFLNEESNIDRMTPVYIDIELDDGEQGTQLAVNVHSLGFNKIFLTTGHSSDSLDVPSCVTRVVGKDFPGLSKFPV